MPCTRGLLQSVQTFVESGYFGPRHANVSKRDGSHTGEVVLYWAFVEQWRGWGDMLPDFLFCSLFPVQQTTSGIGHRVK